MNKKDAWKEANILVEPIVDKHGIKATTSGNILALSVESTPVEQHIAHIMFVAEWLME